MTNLLHCERLIKQCCGAGPFMFGFGSELLRFLRIQLSAQTVSLLGLKSFLMGCKKSKL